MSYYLYAISNLYSLSRGLIKLGCTQHPISRLRVYRTGDAPDIDLEKEYLGLWEIQASSMATMKHKETILHLYFHRQRTKRNSRWTEWFRVDIEKVRSFMDTQSFVIQEVSMSEIKEIHRKTDSDESYPEDIADHMPEEDVRLKQLFFHEFLGEKTPRRIQDEVWDTYASLVKNGSYRGIVQWATGAGKSVAMMILIVITAQYYQMEGKLYRGLLVTHKNDIFDTLGPYLEKLIHFGIHVVRGDHGHFYQIKVPSDKSILITATHASLTHTESWQKLPDLNHIHYDEVHRSTGEQFIDILEEHLEKWNTPFLTGTSATPKTSDVSQHTKMYRLYGNPLSILHRCDVEQAITEGFIASPRFSVHVISDTTVRDIQLQSFLATMKDTIQQKKTQGKIIAYLPFREDVKRIIPYAKADPFWHVYNAISDPESDSDHQFVEAPLNESLKIHVLFACERYREGSDIKGLEMTAVLMGKSICAYILLQIIGRALRLDYPEKEGWCMIMRPSEDGCTEESVFESIVMDIMTFLDQTSGNAHVIRKLVHAYFGEVTVNGKVYDMEETIRRIQAMFERKLFQRPKKERYEFVQQRNLESNITSKTMYYKSDSQPSFIKDPPSYFEKEWKNWAHFFGKDTSIYPPTKEAFIDYCKKEGFDTFEDYQLRTTHHPLIEPSEVYNDWISWDDEMKTECDVIW
jgi:superfamily II DNA or RNA helicase